MKDEKKTKKQLIDELVELRQRVAELEKLEVKQKRAEKRLKAAANEWRTTFDSATELIMLLDSKMKIIKANLATVRFLNMPFNEIIGKTCFKLFHGTDKPPDICPLVKSQKTKQHEEAEFYFPEKDMWIFVTADPIFNDKGNLTGAVHTIRDITERKRAEEALKEAMAFSESTLNAIDDIFYTFDLSGKMLIWNKAVIRVTGYSDTELSSKKPTDLFLGEDVQHISESIERIWKEGSSKAEANLVLKDGRQVPYEFTGSILKDSTGNIIGFSGIGRDLTERKRLEEILKKEQQELKLIIDSSPIIVFYKDKEGKFIRVNKTFAETLKMPEEEFMGKTVFDLYSPKIAQGMTNDDQEVLKSGRPKLKIIEQYESASGIRWVQTDKIPICDNNGIPVGLIGFAQNITERKQAEEALRESEKKYRRIVETANEGIWISDGKHRTTFVNPRMAGMLGYAPDEMLGRRIDSFIFKDDLEDHASQMKLRVRGEGSVYERRFHRKDGTTLWAIVSGSSLSDSQGHFAGAFAMLTDITERKQAEESLKRREQEIRLIAENVPALFSYIDADGCYRFANKQYEAWFGVPQTEIIGKHLRQVLGETTYELIKNSVEAALSGQKVYFEQYLPYVHGGERWVSANYVPDIDELGKVKGFFALVTDITERKRAEEELIQAHRDWEEIFQAIGHPTFMLDPEHNILLGYPLDSRYPNI